MGNGVFGSGNGNWRKGKEQIFEDEGREKYEGYHAQ